MPIPTPRIGPFEINLNTVVVVVGFIGGFVAWGWTLNELQTGRAINATNIEKLEARVVGLEANARRLDNHELRLGNVEQQAAGSAAAMRAVEQSIGQLSSDIRVVREILQRLESRTGGERVPP